VKAFLKEPGLYDQPLVRFIPKALRTDLKWLLTTLQSANDLIVVAGMDDDDEAPEIREHMKEIGKRWNIKVEPC